jgi:hypothetical protein
MVDAIREAGICRTAAEVEIRLARVPQRPFANLLVKIEEARLVGDVRAWLCRHEAARRGRGDGRLLIAWTLTEETPRSD